MADVKQEVKPLPKPLEPAIPREVTTQIEEIMRRLRLLEDRYSGIRKKSQFTEQNMLKDTKEIYEEITLLHGTLAELKSEISDMSEKIVKLTEEIQGSVKKTDFNVLVKYVEFWQPLNFLTREEAERIIQDVKNRKV